MLQFLDAGDWYLMLQDIWRMVSEDNLWGNRDATSKPRITIGLPFSKSNPEIGRGKWIKNEVQDFLYSGG